MDDCVFIAQWSSGGLSPTKTLSAKAIGEECAFIKARVSSPQNENPVINYYEGEKLMTEFSFWGELGPKSNP